MKWTWKEQDAAYRPLQMIHGIVKNPDGGKDEIYQEMEARLRHVKDIGCGGVVTNMGPRDYLEKEEHWELFRESLEMCERMGLRVWLYDEDGYPSGGAGGLTLKGHPEYEAYGLCCLSYEIKKSEYLTVQKPKGYDKVLSVYAIEGDTFKASDRVDLMRFVDEKGTLCWDCAFTGKVYYLVTRPLFEGVHASRNYHKIRRYIDVLDKDAVKRFVEITYEAYEKHAGDFFGNLIEAVFTDEPSVMGGYLPILNIDSRNLLQDIPDPEVPLYPFVVWSRKFAEEFLERKGYDILPFVPLLFARRGPAFRKVRTDYYDVMTSLYEEAFFVAIGDWCSRHGVAFTGHLLSEEALCTQVQQEGEFFRLMRHMHQTGIDMLTADPARVAQVPLLPKTAASAAHQYGRQHVMSETSDFIERQMGENTEPERAFASIAAQFACGVDRFTSYFSEDKYETAVYRRIYDGVSKIGQFLEGGVHVAPLLIYYPAKTAWEFMNPSSQVSSRRTYEREMEACENSLQSALIFFQQNCLDYDLVNEEGLRLIKSDSGYIMNCGKEKYQALYIPYADLETEGILPLIHKLAAAGLLVYIEETEFSPFYAELREDMKTGTVKMVKGPEEAGADLENREIADYQLTENPGILVLEKEENGQQRYLLVNTSKAAAAFSMNFKGTVPEAAYDPYNQVDISLCKRNDRSLWITMEGYGVCLLCTE